MDRIAQGAEQSDQATPSFHLGVLFIHGIGAQKRGQTLAEFGGPVYLWLVDRFHGLDRRWREAIKQQVVEASEQQTLLEQWRDQTEDWATDGFHTEDRRPQAWAEPESSLVAQLAERVNCDTIVGRVCLTDALVHDTVDRSAPAHAELRIQRLRIDGRSDVERWLLAESWWAETFIRPRFAELARWGLRIIPWTIGNHFGAQLRRVFARRPAPRTDNTWRKQTIRWLAWLASLPAPFLGLIVGLLVSPFLLAALAVMLLVWLLPIKQVREALLKLQRTLASTLGDSYVLVTHPIEAASIVGQVRRDIAWLADRCHAVAIVAHSQGGAIAHIALQGGAPPKVRFLFTFGSGLKKLEQLKYLLSMGHSYLRSAIFTLLALPLFSLALVWFALLPMQYPWAAERPELFGQIAIMLGYLLISAIFLLAGLRDYVGAIDLSDLQRWTRRLTKMPLDWVDCFAAADPVSNGVLVEEAAVAKLSAEVCNEASVLRDHTSYWINRDQFVTLLIARLTRSKLRENVGLPPAPELATDQSRLDWIGARRRWRVGHLSVIGWIGIASVLLAVYQEPQFWLSLPAYLADQISALGSRLLGGEARSATSFPVSWPALGYLVLALVPLWITRRLWRAWNEVEMRALVEGSDPGANLDVRALILLVGISAQLMMAAGLAYGEYPPFWIGFASLIGPSLLSAVLAPSAPGETKHLDASASSKTARSHVDQVMTFFARMWTFFTASVVFGFLGWEMFTWVAGYFGDSILGFRPSAVPSLVVGGLVAVLYGIGTLAWARFHRRS